MSAWRSAAASPGIIMILVDKLAWGRHPSVTPAPAEGTRVPGEAHRRHRLTAVADGRSVQLIQLLGELSVRKVLNQGHHRITT